MLSSPRLLVPLLSLVFASAGCGASTSGEGAGEGTTETRPLAAEDGLIEGRIVSDKEARAAKRGSAERAFLEYWAALSYEDWSSAVRYLDLKLRRVLEANYLIAALRIDGQNNTPLKPFIRGVRRTRGSVSIRYMVRTGDGRLRPTSSSWEQRKGVWYMVYSSTLDDSYGSAVQQAVQADLDPLAKSTSRRALSAGIRARTVQAQTLKILPTPTATQRRRRPAAASTPSPPPAVTATPSGSP